MHGQELLGKRLERRTPPPYGLTRDNQWGGTSALKKDHLGRGGEAGRSYRRSQ